MNPPWINPPADKLTDHPTYAAVATTNQLDPLLLSLCVGNRQPTNPSLQAYAASLAAKKVRGLRRLTPAGSRVGKNLSVAGPFCGHRSADISPRNDPQPARNGREPHTRLAGKKQQRASREGERRGLFTQRLREERAAGKRTVRAAAFVWISGQSQAPERQRARRYSDGSIPSSPRTPPRL